MAVAFRSASSAHSSGGVTSFNVPIPAGVAAGDVLVMVWHGWAGSSGSVPPSCTGWTRHFQGFSSNDNFALFSRVADGSEGANATVTIGTTSLVNGGIVAYQGGSAVDAVTDYGSFQFNGSTVNVPSVTTTVANDIVVGVAISAGASAGAPDSGWTERLDHTAASGSLVYAMERAQPSAGASPTAVVTWSGGTTLGQRTYAVAIKPPAAAAPVANFTGTPLSGSAPLSVTFTDSSTNTPTSWAWDFGDGGTSSSQNPSHSYTSSGVYTVALTATNGTGSNTKTSTGYVTVAEAVVYASGAGLDIW